MKFVNARLDPGHWSHWRGVHPVGLFMLASSSASLGRLALDKWCAGLFGQQARLFRSSQQGLQDLL